MRKRKIDELISHFNRKVVEMDIDMRYRMELLGMITAIGIACEKELNVEPEQPEVMSDGTLHITGDIDISKVNRILFSQKGTHYGNLYYVDDDEPERKTGKWNTYCHGDIDFSYSCNQCGYSAPYQMIGGEVFQKKWNYCPNCGADMRGKTDEKT